MLAYMLHDALVVFAERRIINMKKKICLICFLIVVIGILSVIVYFRKNTGIREKDFNNYITYDDKILKKESEYFNENGYVEKDDIPQLLSDVENIIKSGIKDGTIDCIITDHAPHAPEEKAVFEKAPNGVVGLETSLSATLTALYHTGEISLQKVVELMCVNPRKILGLEIPKIEVGKTADLIIADINKKWTVNPEELHSKSHNTVFKGMTLTGKNLMTISKGVIRYENLQ